MAAAYHNTKPEQRKAKDYIAQVCQEEVKELTAPPKRLRLSEFELPDDAEWAKFHDKPLSEGTDILSNT